jgi:hypothetical protein
VLQVIWPDFIAIAIGLYAVNSAISGELRSYRRGGRRKTFYKFRTFWERFAALAIGLAVLAGVVVDLRRKFPH